MTEYAFPCIHEIDGNWQKEPSEEHRGMSLRDYFAAHAPLHDLKFASTEAAAKFVGCEVPTTDEALVVVAMKAAAKASRIFADAMIEELKK